MVVEAVREEMELFTADQSHHELHDEGVSNAEVAPATSSPDSDKPDPESAFVATAAQAAGSPEQAAKLGNDPLLAVQSADGFSDTSRDKGQLTIPSVQQLKQGAAEFKQVGARVTLRK